MTNLAYNNIIQFPKLELVPGGTRKTDSILKSNGVPKATAAEPIRSPEDIKKMADYFKETSPRNYAIFIAGITFGIRGSDLIKLRIRDIQGSHLNIIETKTRKRNSPLITNKVRDAINKYLKTKPNLQPDDYLFTTSRTDESGRYKPITIQTLNNIVKKGAKECHVDGHISSHSLRKTFAYQSLKMNEFDEEARFTLQAMLNHSDMRTTMTYAGLTRDKQDEMRQGLEQLF